jgi:hypothetical protein
MSKSIQQKSDHFEPSCSVRTVGQMDKRTDRQTEMTKLVVAFRNFVNASKIGTILRIQKGLCFRVLVKRKDNFSCTNGEEIKKNTCR